MEMILVYNCLDECTGSSILLGITFLMLHLCYCNSNSTVQDAGSVLLIYNCVWDYVHVVGLPGGCNIGMMGECYWLVSVTVFLYDFQCPFVVNYGVR